MEKLTEQDGKSLDMVSENLEALKAIFPEAFTEDGVDFEALRQLLGDAVAEGEEKYGLTWHGKKKARQIALMPSLGTLRPCKEESVDWDTTQNLFIEGDNLEVLKLLQKSYANKVKMIYIDPPYNTGKEFIYPDKFQDNLDTYLRYTGQKDDEGFKVSSNTESSGRYHTNWLNMMYPRLKLARNLLRDDGVIFISIDDHEVASLRKLCDEIYGEESFIGILVWEKKKKGAFLSGNITNVKEYVVCYTKNDSSFDGLIGEIARASETYPVIKTTNTRGERTIRAGIPSKFREDNHIVKKGTRISSGNMELILLDDLIIKNKILQSDVRVDSNWIYSQKLLDEYAIKGELYVTQDLYFRRIVNEPRYKRMKDLLPRVGKSGESGETYKFSEDLFSDGWGTNEDGNAELHDLLGVQNIFQFPKPSKLIAKILASVQEEECIVLDFFAGSATTGHAVWYLNKEAKKKHHFLLVQLPEPIDSQDKDFKRAYDFCQGLGVPANLAEIGKERIRRAAAKIKEENPDYNGDLGFKVFKLDSSNIRAWNPDRNDLEQTLIDHIEHLIEGRSEEDVLYELLLKRGVDLTVPIEERIITTKGTKDTKQDTKENVRDFREVRGSKKVFSIGYGVLFACLAKEIKKEEVEDLAMGIIDWHKELSPASDTQVVFRDSAFDGDIAKTNMTAILEQHGIAHVRSL